MSNEHRKGPRELCTGGEWIYGRNPAVEVMPNEDEQLQRIRDEAQARRLVIRTMDRDALDRLTRFGHHQGVALKVDAYPYVDFGDILGAVEDDENAKVVILDHLEDPQNVGSILRTACAIGVTGVIIPEDRGSGVTPAAVRASAGASEYLKVARVVNLVRAMKQLKDANMWLTGLDWGKDAKPYTEIDFKGRAGLVVGAEGTGISRLVRETCDFIAVLPMRGEIESLNAGVAAAVCMYEMVKGLKD